jgi:Protein of unknown function (DUF4012)
VRTRERLRNTLKNWRLMVPVGLALVLLLGVGWVGLRGAQASGHLGTAAHLFVQLKQQVESGDAGSAKRTLASLRRETDAARDETAGPAWSIGTVLPKVGDDMAAARTIAGALDLLADDALPPLLDAATGLESAVLAPEHGRIDLAALQRAAPSIAKADAVIRTVRARIAAVPTKGLDARIATRIPELLTALQRAEQLAGPAGRAMSLLPSMLGANGKRTYLLMFQNLAEMRATGGMPGAYIVIQADHGEISVVDQGTATGLRTFATPVLTLDPDLVDLHTERIATFPADVDLTPDFPTAATVMREMYRLRSGRTVDGVISADPVALSYLLQATGPVPIAGHAQLTAGTAVRQLLNDVYLRMPDNATQDAYFSEVARAVFNALFAQHGDPRAEVAALARSAGERRLLMWSAHADEQAEIATTVMAGTLPTDDGAHPTVGVFLNDGTGAKLGYYVRRSVSLATAGCLEDGTRELRLTVTLTSTAPKTGLPVSITGLALGGPGNVVRTNVMIYSPTGGSAVDTRLNGAETDVGLGVEKGRVVSVVTVDLAPGQTATVETGLITGALPASAGALTPRLVTTPAVTPWTTIIKPGPAC